MSDKEKQPKKAKTIPKKAKKAALPELEEMLKAGVHFGHRTSKWNAKMEPYIFASRNNVHIVDLEKSREKLEQALKVIEEFKRKKQVILFVGTKVSAREIVKKFAQEAKMPYVVEKWVGGTLTNFEAISKRLAYFRDLEKNKEKGELEKYTKKERHEFDVELEKLRKRFGGIKEMVQLPDALLVVDVHKEKIAVKEARTKKIPIIGICDTNSDPSLVDWPVPANDDAVSSLKLILGALVSALK